MPDDVGVKDAALVELVARAMMGDSHAWEHLSVSEKSHLIADARAAIAAMQPALDAAREAGRREGLVVAKGECETRASAVRRANTRGGQLTADGHFGVGIALSCADDIRALIPATPAPINAADVR